MEPGTNHASALDFGIVYPLWNHTRDAGNLLERVVGEVGIDHITIPVVTGPVSQLRLAWFPDAPYFHTEGGWHFPPDAKLYSASGIKPRAAKWCGGRDVLGEVCSLASGQGIGVHFLIDALRIPAVVEHSPQLSQRSAWGQVYANPSLCIGNPTVRELIATTLTDLERYGPRGLQLAGLELDVLDSAGLPHWAQSGLHQSIDMCFCAACREIAASANVDPDHAARSARICTETCFASEGSSTTPTERLLDQDKLVTGYVGARSGAAAAWLDRIAGGLRAERKLLRVNAANDISLDAATIRSEAWPVMPILGSTAYDGELEADSERFRRRRGNFDAVATSAWCHGHDPTPSGQLVRWVSHATERGVRQFDFFDIEQSPREVVTWLKQAVRYARRG